jgi:hypothetical protein
MKRHQIVLIVCGSFFALVCLGAGWFLFSAMCVKNAAAETRNDAYGELKKIYNAKVFPSDENIARVKADEKALETWLNTVSNLVHKGDLHIEKESPTSFKQMLQSTVRSLSAQPGAVNGKIVPSGFNFGFDKYLGESDSLPTQEHVDRLARQLKMIELICKELYSSKIMSLEKVERETFDEAQTDEQRQKRPEDTGKKRRNNKKDNASSRAAKALATGASEQPGEFYSKQRFTVVFKARPDAFAEALNRLAAMEMFVVVAETSFQKTDDPLTKRDAKKAEKKKDTSSALGGVAAVDPASVPHAERIVTDPELESPVTVELAIDVYSFEGV